MGAPITTSLIMLRHGRYSTGIDTARTAHIDSAVPTPFQHFGAEYLGCTLVGGCNPGGVDAQGGGASAAVAESAGDGGQVYTGAEQFGGAVVAQRVQMGGDALLHGHGGVPVGHPVRIPRPFLGRVVGEQVPVVDRGHVQQLCPLLCPVAVLDEDGDGVGVEGDAAHLVGLVSFSMARPRRWTSLRRISSTLRSRWTWCQRRARASLRRMPVVITSQTIVPHVSSCAQAAVTRAAAWPELGGSGCGGGDFGRLAVRATLTLAQSQRTAASKAPLRMACSTSTEEGASGRHSCGPHLHLAQSCSPCRRCSTNARPLHRVRQRRSSP